jgi:hypothetical protein
MGRRAWLEAFEDKVIPSLVADAEGEVAAALKVTLKFYRGTCASERKAGAARVTKVPQEMCLLRRFQQLLNQCGRISH